MKRLTSYLIPLTSCILMVACGPSVPAEYAQSDKWPAIYPDYAQVTVPVNIAPLSFEYDGQADEMVARYAVGNDEIVCNGQPSIDEWHALAEKAKGNAITVDVYTRNGDQWTRFKPFNIYVSPDSIDPYISYRLIAPSYVTYEALTINQRCLENYDESVIYDNILCGFEKDGQCINCHHYQQYNPQRMQFHARQNMGGTVIAYDGRMKKVNMRNDSILSAGVYPAWHPTLNLIVYATDKTLQNFHTVNPNKVEVYDEASDIIVHWVDAATAENAEVRVYDYLFSDPDPDGPDKDFLDCLNPNSLEILTGCKVEASLADVTPPGHFQFMRLGYFCLDSKDSGEGLLVLLRCVSLKDSFKPAL